MSGEHNLTPDQRMIPKSIREEAYHRFPLTCDHVRMILDEIKSSIMCEYAIPVEDEAGVDAIISHAFLRIRDEVTQPFRTEQMRLLLEWRKLGGLLFNNEGTREHPFEGDLYLALGQEFAKPRATVKRTVFGSVFGMGKPGEESQPMIDRCRNRLLQLGWVPVSQAKKIEFTRDVEAMVNGGPLQFGACEEQSFDKGQEVDVKSVEVQPKPSSDMAKVVFADGTWTMLHVETFEIVKDSEG